MNLQFRLVDLLSEIDIICREEHLNYCLAEDTAWNAVNKGFLPDDAYEANIFMPAEDVETFCKAAIIRFPEREIESLYDNPNFPGFYVRYVDSSSLCFDLDKEKHFQTHGFHINILILRNPIENRFRRKFFSALERLWEYKEEQRLGERSRYYRLGTFFWKCFGERAGSRFLYKSLLKHGKIRQDGSLFYHTTRGRYGNFDKKFWDKKETIWLNGLRFFCLGTQYLPEKAPKYNKLKWSTIFDENIPYEKFIHGLKKRGLFEAGWIKGREKYAHWYKESAETTRKQVQQYWLYMFRTQARFSLWDYYADKRELLNKAYEKGAFDDLREILEPYMKEIRAYKRKSLGLCFDPIILKIALTVYCRQGKFRFAEKVLELIPVEHFESIGEYESRKALGEPINMSSLRQRKEGLESDLKKLREQFELEESEKEQNNLQNVQIEIQKGFILFECKSGRAFCGVIKQVFEMLAKKYPKKFQFVCVINGDLASERETELEKRYERILSFVKKGSMEYKRMLGIAEYIFVDDLLLPEYFVRKEGQFVIQVPYWEHIPWNMERIWKNSKKMIKTFKQTTHFLIDETMEEYPVWKVFLSKIQDEVPECYMILVDRTLDERYEENIERFWRKKTGEETDPAQLMLYECTDGKPDKVKGEINKIRCIGEFIPEQVLFRVSAELYETLKNDSDFSGNIIPRTLNSELLYDKVDIVAASDSLPFVLNAKIWGKNAVVMNLREKIGTEISMHCREHSIKTIETAADFYLFLEEARHKQRSQRKPLSQRGILVDAVDRIINGCQ